MPVQAAIYRRGKDGYALLVGVYIDDLVITGEKVDEVEAFKEEMKAIFPDERPGAPLLLGDRGAPRRLQHQSQSDCLRQAHR